MVNNQNTNPTRNPETLWKRFGNEIVTLNRETRQYHVLNAAAAIIFQSATGDNTMEDIAEIIAEVFGIDIGQALSDARETVDGMKKLGLVSAS